MQAHSIAPCASALKVAIVTRVVLFLGVQPVPVNVVGRVCVPFTNKVLPSRCGSSKTVISCLCGWLCDTVHRTLPAVEEGIRMRLNLIELFQDLSSSSTLSILIYSFITMTLQSKRNEINSHPNVAKLIESGGFR